MDARAEHNAELDKDYWSDDGVVEVTVRPRDALSWLTSIADGEVPEEVMEFLLDALDAVKHNEKCTVFVLAADFCDKHEREIKEYLK